MSDKRIPSEPQAPLAALEVTAEDVIQMMDRAGDDIPHQAPLISVEIPRVGLLREHVPVQIRDPFGSSSTVSLQCSLDLRCYVPADKRGIHTSRISSAVAEHSTRVFTNLQEYAQSLSETLMLLEYGGSALTSVAGVLSYVQEVKGWKPEKDKLSLEHLYYSATVEMDEHTQLHSATLGFNHITACPCVQETYRHALLAKNGDLQGAIEEVSPLLTHSQRCKTTVKVENLARAFPFREVLEVADRVVHRVKNTLPREYELDLVYRAHARPQFAEDAIRELGCETALALEGRFDGSRVAVSTQSFESIHDYDLVASLEVPIGGKIVLEESDGKRFYQYGS
jgi:GTP cyclohydrolase FolE2